MASKIKVLIIILKMRIKKTINIKCPIVKYKNLRFKTSTESAKFPK